MIPEKYRADVVPSFKFFVVLSARLSWSPSATQDEAFPSPEDSDGLGVGPESFLRPLFGRRLGPHSFTAVVGTGSHGECSGDGASFTGTTSRWLGPRSSGRSRRCPPPSRLGPRRPSSDSTYDQVGKFTLWPRRLCPGWAGPALEKKLD